MSMASVSDAQQKIRGKPLYPPTSPSYYNFLVKKSEKQINFLLKHSKLFASKILNYIDTFHTCFNEFIPCLNYLLGLVGTLKTLVVKVR